MDFQAARSRLIEHLSQEIRNRRVLEAMARVPRELFVPSDLQKMAYEDSPLTIGWGQTISQPFIVALMTEALELSGVEKVLEVGTGSGYQAAILSRLARSVITVERIPALAERARQTLAELDCRNVEVRIAEDKLGWPQSAPYDAIVVTAAAPSVPASLMEQLSEGGRLVVPMGSRWEQILLKVIKCEGKEARVNLGACRFVPLIGPEAWGPEAQDLWG